MFNNRGARRWLIFRMMSPPPPTLAPMHYKQHSPDINLTDAKTIFNVLIYEHWVITAADSVGNGGIASFTHKARVSVAVPEHDDVACTETTPSTTLQCVSESPTGNPRHSNTSKLDWGRTWQRRNVTQWQPGRAHTKVLLLIHCKSIGHIYMISVPQLRSPLTAAPQRKTEPFSSVQIIKIWNHVGKSSSI